MTGPADCSTAAAWEGPQLISDPPSEPRLQPHRADRMAVAVQQSVTWGDAQGRAPRAEGIAVIATFKPRDIAR